MRKDLIYAIRVLMKKPSFSVVAVLTLAIGIAANTTIFSLIHGVLLRPLPFPDPARILSVWTSYPASNYEPDVFSPANYLDVAARTKTLSAIAGYDTPSYTLTGSGEPESISCLRSTASMGAVLGVKPQLGRWFTEREDESTEPVVVISDSFWRTRLSGSRDALGTTLILNGKPHTIIGVLPPRSSFPSALTHLYVPISFTPEMKAGRGNIFMSVVARLAPGVERSTAEAELRTIAAALAKEHPGSNTGIGMGAVPLDEEIVGNMRRVLLVMWVAVAFLLTVACANVANLLLAHAAAREREFAVRRALGASNGRLVRQMLTESVLLALLGGAAGVAFSAWTLPALLQRLPEEFPRIGDVGLNSEVLWYTLAVSLLTGILFGLAPATRFARRDLAPSIREGSLGAGSGARQRRLGRFLVAGEIAVVIVLLVGAGLVLQTLKRLTEVDPGFRPERLLAWQMFLPSARYPNVDVRRTFHRRVIEQVETLPGVESAALAVPLPFGPATLVTDTSFTIAGQPAPAPDQRPQANVARVSRRYFETMGIPLRAGRMFTEEEHDQGTPAVIVSEALVRRHFAGVDPLSHALQLGKRTVPIVGVVGDVKHNDLRSAIRPEFYLPLEQFASTSAALVVRTATDPASLLPSVQRRVWSIDSAIPGNLAAPVDSVMFASLAPARVTATLLAVFAGAALLLGLAGVFAVLSYAVNRRTREIGIRLALGASERETLGMVLREALGLGLAGAAIGIPCALALSRYMSTLLYGVSPLDPFTYVAVGLIVPAAAVVAAYHPARRATRVDPAVSLRAE